MSRTTSIILGALITLFLARDAAAQWNVARYEDHRNHLLVTSGLDPAMVTELGYGRVFRAFGRDLQLAGNAGVVTADVDVSDFRARLGAQTWLLRWRSLHFTGSATFITRGTENSIYRGLNFGSDFTATLGAYRHGWFAAGEFGYDKAIITHITQSDWYRDNFYPEAKDGWYLDAGGTFHYGLTGGIALGRAEIFARLGWRRTERFNDLIPPVYGNLGVGFGL